MSTRAAIKMVVYKATLARHQLERELLAEKEINYRLEEYEALRLFKNVPSVYEIAAIAEPRLCGHLFERERMTKRAAVARRS